MQRYNACIVNGILKKIDVSSVVYSTSVAHNHRLNTKPFVLGSMFHGTHRVHYNLKHVVACTMVINMDTPANSCNTNLGIRKKVSDLDFEKQDFSYYVKLDFQHF